MSNNTGQRAPRTRAVKEAQGAGGTTTWIPQDQRMDPSYRPTTTAGPTTTCSGGGSSCVLSKLIQLPAPPLSRHQLKKLEEHRYSSAGHSLLEPFMQHYWEWLVARVPAWIAPNLITIVGLATNILTTLVLVYYCPTATEQAPLWAYLSCAVGLFIYQSLDAIDGKQARRTNNSTPLGELFDHGCDSLSTVFVVLGTCIAVQLGTNPDWMFFCCFAGMFMFYCAHWQTYVSGTLRFGM